MPRPRPSCLSPPTPTGPLAPGEARIGQLRLDLLERPAPAAALWELLPEGERRTAEALMARMIAQTLAPEEAGEGE